MDELGVVQTFLDVIEQLEIPYMLVGSLSSNAFGVARTTQDADLVVLLRSDDLKRISQLLPTGFTLDQQASFETITGKTRYEVKIEEPIFKIELFELGDGPFDASRFDRRCRVDLDGRMRYMQTAEDVIIQKLHWFSRARRRKDHDDIRDVIRTQNEFLDWNYIRHWCGELGITSELERMLDAIRRSEGSL
ncbi:MAG: hypothetical protein WC058_11355 [Phycisphaeraceae bacterium]